MFNVGRYDPRTADRRRSVPQKNTTGAKRSSEKERKRPRKESDDVGVERASKSATKVIAKSKKEEELKAPSSEEVSRSRDKQGEQQERTEGAESDSSSSVPSSSEASSEDENDNSLQNPKRSTLRVIAPEAASTDYGRRRLDLIDEAFDDFDVDNELLDNTETDPATTQVREEKPQYRVDAKLPEEIKTALHMSNLPIEEAAAAWELAPFLAANLKRDGYENFFPIQSLVIPDVITSERHVHIRARDVCVAAPTGSGKTLAFVLPVLNALSKRNVRRLRALVVLPSRDLASQVYEVFDRYTEGSDLRVGLAIGQSDFRAEQRALTVGTPDKSKVEDMNTTRLRYSLDKGNLDLALKAFPGVTDCEAPPQHDGELNLPDGGVSAVDVLVATPGRLVDHLDKTPGFTLQHLRFLVIDEADRLVNQSYHNWIGRVVASANAASVNAWHKLSTSDPDDTLSLRLASDCTSVKIDPITWRRGGAGGDDLALNVNTPAASAVTSVCRPAQLRKLLFSATLTKDPQKLAALGLVNPKHFDAHHLSSQIRASSQRYSMPPALSEFTVECTAEQKPLVLLALLLEQLQRDGNNASEKTIVVVFTSSLDSTHRLVRLLQLLWASAGFGSPSAVGEFSSALNQKQRTKLMKRCNDVGGDVSVIVCSDGMSRGMDIPSVSAVINYDVPSFAKTYVHRCGRTARAGKSGRAISVLKGGQVRQFQRMRKLIDDPSRVNGVSIRKDLVRDAISQYRACVKALRDVIQAEEDGEFSGTDAIPRDFIPS